jgi:polyisoprenoid-binding protein YceI
MHLLADAPERFDAGALGRPRVGIESSRAASVTTTRPKVRVSGRTAVRKGGARRCPRTARLARHEGAIAMNEPLSSHLTPVGTPADAPPLAAGRWAAESTSRDSFSSGLLGLVTVRGAFGRFDATLDVGPTLSDVEVLANVDLSSVDTKNARRDHHLRSRDFFDAQEPRPMEFRSRSVTGGGDSYELGGDLTIGGRTRPVTLAVEFLGTECELADRRVTARFRATGQIRRSEFGLDAVKRLVHDKVTVTLEMQFVACAATS